MGDVEQRLEEAHLFSLAEKTAAATRKCHSLFNKTRGGIDCSVRRDNVEGNCAERHQFRIDAQGGCQGILTALSAAGEQDPSAFSASHRSKKRSGYAG